MSVTKNIAILRGFIEEILSKGNLERLHEFISTEFVLHSTPMVPEIKGLEAYRQFMSGTKSAFPDSHGIIEKTVAEGDMVAAVYQFSGTFKGELIGIPPNGKTFTIRPAIFVRFKDGKIVEIWEYYDSLAFYRQLGFPLA
jgi:steroid delta-isomerase-like uncharacterized protein